MTERASVVGAGVIGLSVAVVLAERGVPVEIVTREDPLHTTSVTASAMVGPSFAPPDSPTGRRERAGIETFTALAGDPRTGVRLRSGRLAARQPGGPLPGNDRACEVIKRCSTKSAADEVGRMTACPPEELPPGFASASRTTLPLVDMPVYLAYLARRFAAAGGRVTRRAVSSLDELDAPLLVNCAGLGARELVGDLSVRPVRGQHVIVQNPGLEEFFIEAPFTPTWTAYWPYDDHVVLGSVADEDDDNIEPDAEQGRAILQRCVAVEPRLAGAAVLAQQVGLRPVRPEVRLDAENLGATRCVHNYGHGGSGVTLSWGCAYEAADLLLTGRSPGDPGDLVAVPKP